MFFKTYGDSLEFFNGFLQERFRGRPEAKPQFNLGGWIPGQNPASDSVAGPEWKRRKDSITQALRKQSGGGNVFQGTWEELVEKHREEKRQQMEELEKQPWTKSAFQTFRIGDSLFIRHRGEYKFRPIETVPMDTTRHYQIRHIET